MMDSSCSSSTLTQNQHPHHYYSSCSSSFFSFCFVLLLCLASLPSTTTAQDPSIFLYGYYDTSCSTGTHISVASFRPGRCTYDSYTNTYIKGYCYPTIEFYGYRYASNDPSCSGQIISVLRLIPSVCSAGGLFVMCPPLYNATDAGVAPALPVSADGYATMQDCTNSACSTACTKIWTKANTCIPYVDVTMPSVKAIAQTCTNNNQLHMAYYADTTCSTLMQLTALPLNDQICRNGRTITCPSANTGNLLIKKPQDMFVQKTVYDNTVKDDLSCSGSVTSRSWFSTQDNYCLAGPNGRAASYSCTERYPIISFYNDGVCSPSSVSHSSSYLFGSCVNNTQYTCDAMSVTTLSRTIITIITCLSALFHLLHI